MSSAVEKTDMNKPKKKSNGHARKAAPDKATVKKGDMITITIDGKEIKCAAGRNLVDVANENDIFIPSLCYYPEIDFDLVDLYTIPADGGEMQKIAAPKGMKMLPSFSPDGKLIAYLGREGRAAVTAAQPSVVLGVPLRGVPRAVPPSGPGRGLPGPRPHPQDTRRDPQAHHGVLRSRRNVGDEEGIFRAVDEERPEGVRGLSEGVCKVHRLS